MSPKTGRPPVDKPRSEQYRLRLTQEEVKKLEYCCDQTGKTKAEILREGLEKVYMEVAKEK